MIRKKQKALHALTGLLVLSACQPVQTTMDAEAVEVRPAKNASFANEEIEAESYYQLGKAHLAATDYGLAIDAFRRSLKQSKGCS